MSKLRARIKMAEQSYSIDPNTGYYIFNDGTVVDPDTGEILEKHTQTFQDIMYEEKPMAYRDYPGEEYKNQWNKVSPINVLFVDRINEIYFMDPETAKQTIIQTIEDMNRKYGHDDDSYSYMTQDYINKVKFNLSKMRTIEQIMNYLTNIHFKGLGMGASKGKKINKRNKNKLRLVRSKLV